MFKGFAIAFVCVGSCRPSAHDAAADRLLIRLVSFAMARAESQTTAALTASNAAKISRNIIIQVYPHLA